MNGFDSDDCRCPGCGSCDAALAKRRRERLLVQAKRFVITLGDAKNLMFVEELYSQTHNVTTRYTSDVTLAHKFPNRETATKALKHGEKIRCVIYECWIRERS